MPFFFPEFALRPLTVRAFNAFYYKRHPMGRHIVDYDRFFYPLDAVQHWNRVYGKRGFHQYQAVLPSDPARACLRELLEALSGSCAPSFLAVLKAMGESSGGLLSFPMKGYTLALDLPAGPGTADFLRSLDQIVLRHGGRVYLAKDSCMTRRVFPGHVPAGRPIRAHQIASSTRRTESARRCRAGWGSGAAVSGSVLIIGATSGVGRALAREWAARAERLILAARDPAELHRIAADVALRSGTPVAEVVFDALAFDTS